MSAADRPAPATIGPYRITARVGAGGMGEVFKAWDPRLERDVAIKLLHPDASRGPEYQRRLLAEGRAASALTHPNILRVYDADIDGDAYYLVSEWLEGKSLRDELSRGPLSLKRLIDLSVQIADGLAAAHAMGIVHRDIKPENVMLARDGSARIVDFGLARVDPHSPGAAAVVGNASTVTLDGGISGTPGYMSPEQARGQFGDFRTDQFSFGALLYEMATGKPAFRRASTADTLSAVLNEEPPPLGEANPRVPSAFRWIVEQCLAKEPADRYAATDDLARELRRLRDRLSEAIAEPKTAAAALPRRRPWATAAIGVGALAAGLLAGLPYGGGTEPALEFTPLATASAYEGTPAWSPDGQSLAYVADVDGVLQVFVRRIGDAVSHQVTRTRFDAERPFWAPGGQQLSFISLAGDSDALWSIGVAGGAPSLVLENVTSAAIDPSGKRLALLRRTGDRSVNSFDVWWSIPPGAAPTQELREPFAAIELVAAQMSFSADGQLLLWGSESGGQGFFYLFPADGGPPRRVLSHVPRPVNLSAFTWLGDNRHVTLALADARLRSRHLWIADTQSESLRQVTSTHTNETDPAFAPASNLLAYVTEDVDFDLFRLTADGRARLPVLTTARNEFDPAWAPSGDRFAFVTDRGGGLEIWGQSVDGRWEQPIVRATDFTSITESIGTLAYSHDGNSLAFQRSRDGAFEIWTAPATGGAPVRVIEAKKDHAPYQNSPTWSPDNTWIAFSELKAGQQEQTLTKVRVGTQQMETLTERLVTFTNVRWSPDGLWIMAQTLDGLARIPADGGTPLVFSEDSFIDFTWAPDSQHVFALGDSERVGHFALVEIDSTNGATKVLNADLGPIPVANQPIRGFSYLPGQGFLTSMASARSDIWLLEGFQAPGRRWLGRWRP